MQEASQLEDDIADDDGRLPLASAAAEIFWWR